MTIEIWGRRRHGKTKIGVALALWAKYVLGIPVYTNEPKMIQLGLAENLTKEKLIHLRNAFIFWDEFWREMDSHDWKNPNSNLMTHWWQMQGHFDLIFAYTTQLRSQMNNRIRESNDYSIHCEKTKIGKNEYSFKYTLYDGISFDKLKTWITETKKEKFLYELYDTLSNPKMVLN